MLDKLISWELDSLYFRLEGDQRKDILKSQMDEHLIWQEQAKEALIDAVVNSLNVITQNKGPLGVFLFTWPSGVGKTESARALARVLLGDENGITLIHGEQLTEQHTAGNLFGSPKWYVGYGDLSLLSKLIYEPYEKALKKKTICPFIKRFWGFNIIVIDEIDKCHPKVIQTLLGAIDDWVVHLPDGKTILDFSTSIFIFTSNHWMAEARDIDDKHSIGFVPKTTEDKSKAKRVALNRSLKQFSPEMMNRIHKTVHFDVLNNEDLLQIVGKYINRINEALAKVGEENFPKINMVITKELADHVIKEWTENGKGTRWVIRFFKDKVESLLGAFINSSPEFEKYCDYEIETCGHIIKDEIVFWFSKDWMKPKPPKPPTNIIPLDTQPLGRPKWPVE